MNHVLLVFSFSTLSCSVSLHKVVEVREGQKTKKFDKFPFEEVEEQSFSLIFEQECKSVEVYPLGMYMYMYINC